MEASHGMRCNGAQGGVDGLDALVCVEYQLDVQGAVHVMASDLHTQVSINSD